MFCVSDFEEHAKKVLPKNAWDYYASGANQQQTLRDNVEAFRRYRFRPHVLRDISRVDLRVQLQGQWVESPIGVAPIAMQKMAHHEGECATAKACARNGACMMLSSWSTTSMEEVAAACSHQGLRWFQLYVYRNQTLTANMIHRAEKAGYKALVITVDTPILGRRLADARNKFNLPPHLSLANFKDQDTSDFRAATELVVKTHDSGLHQYTKELIDPSLDWEGIKWALRETSLPIILKGILTREAAREAVRCGVKGIVVSNHGARQLDGVPATIDALSEVVSAVGGEVEVYLDGGVRQGTDVLKALAMGAKAVFVGRPILWGLAYGGGEGVEQVLHMLRDELALAMQLAGCPKIMDIRSELVVHESYYKSPRAKL